MDMPTLIIDAHIEVFGNEDGVWILVSGEGPFGPHNGTEEALDALPDILRSLP